MSIAIISMSAFLISILTFFSGFGLGTLLTPVFAIWFRMDIAIALTAVVHFLNNLFKLFLVGRFANLKVVLRFGLPAVLAAAAGAFALTKISIFLPLTQYSLFGKEFQIFPLKLLIAILILIFTFFESVPVLKNISVKPKYLSLGGILSGFFGGLSGHQGALRSVFLIQMKLPKESFIATGIVVACLIDVVRLGVYFKHFSQDNLNVNSGVIISATLSAFCGAYLGNKLLKKITLKTVQIIVSICLVILALSLGMGII